MSARKFGFCWILFSEDVRFCISLKCLSEREESVWELERKCERAKRETEKEKERGVRKREGKRLRKRGER